MLYKCENVRLTQPRTLHMPRPILAEDSIHPAIRAKVGGWQHKIVDEVKAAVAANDVVVVGMDMNPWPRKARKALDGSYLGVWRPRSALKMWTGWPSYPMVFVKGTLIGGYTDLQALIDSGEFKKMLASKA